MKILVTTNLNTRVGGPETTFQKGPMRLNGEIIDVSETVEGEDINGNNSWYDDGNGNYYWSGGTFNLAFDVAKCWWLNDFSIQQLWDKGLTGAGIKIAVLDTGVSLPHDGLDIDAGTNCGDITNSQTTFLDIDKDAHGTHCMGIIKAANTAFGITGVAFNSDVFVCKVSADINAATGETDDDIAYIEMGINWAIEKGVDIISISKGFFSDYKNIQPTVQAALNKNILIICAGGNNTATNSYTEIFYPAFYDECLSVGALQQGNIIAGSTITSGRLKLLAPGINIISLSSNNGYKKLSGSSQAAPFVAGIAAITLQYLNENGKQYNTKGIYKLLADAAAPVDGYTAKIINPINILKLIDDGQEVFI
jgi:subtilisin family serine protease